MNSPEILLFNLGAPGPVELIIILVIALLLFGKRLPGVARSLGKGVVEFKRGLKGMKDDVENPDVDDRAIEDSKRERYSEEEPSRREP